MGQSTRVPRARADTGAVDAAVAPGGTPTVDALEDHPAVRPLTDSTPAERALAQAIAGARADASARLDARFDRLDLAQMLRSYRAPQPAMGQLSVEGWRDLAPIEALDTFLAVHDVRDDPGRPEVSRLLHTRDGVDANHLPVDGMVLPKHGMYSTFRANPAGLVAALVHGSSFVVKALDEAVPHLGAVCEDLELVLGARTSALAYLGGPSGRGWGGHFDNHNVLIVQAHGTRRWRVSAPVERWPLLPHSPYAVSDNLWWEGVLHPGDVLFIPRGWGHEVTGTDDISVHLTFPLRVRTAEDVLISAAAGAHRHGALRQDVPPGAVPSLDDMGHGLPEDAAAQVLAWWRARMPSRARPRFTEVHRLRRDLEIGNVVRQERARLSAPGGFHALRTPAAGGRQAFAAAGCVLWLSDAEAAAVASLLDSSGDLAAVARRLPDHRPLLLGLLDRNLLELAPPSPPHGAGAIESPAVALRDHLELGAVGPPPWPEGGVRGVRSDAPDEALLEAALERGRQRSITWLAEAVPDLDLAAAVQRTRRPELVRARLTDGALAELAGLEAVDQVLGWHDLAPPKLKLARDGDPTNREPPDDLFVSPYSAYSPMVVNPGRLSALLAEANTLIMRGIDEVVPRLSRFVSHVERVAGRRSGINAYVSFGPAPGFGAHWDDHDVLIVQIAGEKTWRCHEPLEPHPMGGMSPRGVSDKEVWRGALRPGDVLYIPRGWGHMVEGDDQLSVHFTFPLRGMIAAAVAEHGVKAAYRDTRQRSDVPVPASAGALAADMLAADMLAAGPEVVDEAVAFWRARVPPRVNQAFSASAALEAGVQTGTVRLTAGAGLGVARNGEAGAPLTVVLGDRSVALRRRADAELLACLLEGRSVPVAELLGDPPDPQTGRFLADLVRDGLAEYAAEPGPRPVAAG